VCTGAGLLYDEDDQKEGFVALERGLFELELANVAIYRDKELLLAEIGGGYEHAV
jgi:hypothetical protein